GPRAWIAPHAVTGPGAELRGRHRGSRPRGRGPAGPVLAGSCVYAARKTRLPRCRGPSLRMSRYQGISPAPAARTVRPPPAEPSNEGLSSPRGLALPTADRDDAWGFPLGCLLNNYTD